MSTSGRVRPKTAGPTGSRAAIPTGRRPGTASGSTRPMTATRRGTHRGRPSTAAAAFGEEAPTVQELAQELKMSRSGVRPASHMQRPTTATSALSSSRIRRRPKTAMESFRKKNPFAHPDAWVEDGDGTDSSSAEERFLAPTNRTFKKLAKSEAHYHQRQLSLKALRDIDKGSKSAREQMRANQEALRRIGTYDPVSAAAKQQTSQVPDFPMVEPEGTGARQTRMRQALSETKQRGRTALFAYTMDKRMEVATQECEREAVSRVRTLQHELQSLQRDINLDGYSKRELQKDVVQDRLVEEDYKHIIEMLRLKMQKMSEREMSMEEELMNYRKYEPIFRDLSEKYDFESAEDVIRKLQNLEMDQMDKYASLLEMKEAKEKTGKMLDNFSTQKEGMKMDQLGDLHQAKVKIEKIVHELDRQLEDVRASLDKARGTKQKSLELADAVRDLYTYWSDKAERIGEYLDPPRMDQPLAVIQRFSNLFEPHAPYRVAHTTHTLHALGNSLWSQFFSDHPDMKCKPVEIYRAVANLLASKKEYRKMMKDKVARAKLDNKRLTRDFDNRKREAKRLALDVSKWKNKWHKEFQKFENKDSEIEFEGKMKTMSLGRHTKKRTGTGQGLAAVANALSIMKIRAKGGKSAHAAADETTSAVPDSDRDILSLHASEPEQSESAGSHIRKYLE